MADPANDGPGLGPRARLMQEVASQMDAIEADFGDDFEILKVITVLQLRRPDGELSLRVRNTASPLEAIGMLSFAQDFVKAQGIA